jgi:hypothetical protein
MSHQDFRMMKCCSAGVPPAICLISTRHKRAGETPALRNPTFLRHKIELHFADRIRRDELGLAKFNFVFAPVANLSCPAYAMIRFEIQREF